MMKTYVNPYSEAISTVQLSPFSETQWHRLAADPTVYPEWTPATMNNQHQRKNLDRWKIIGPIDINNLKAEDTLLLQELQHIRKVATIAPSLASAKDRKQRRQSKYSDDEHDPRTTSPSEEYDGSSDFFFQTRETSLSQRQLTEKQLTFYSQIAPPPTTNSGYTDALPNVPRSAKRDASLRTQLRQSAQTRECVLANTSDRRSISPLSMASSKRAVGAIANLARHPRLSYRHPYGLAPPPSEASLVTGFKEQIASDIASCTSSKKSSARSKNPNRMSMHLLKTRNDRSKQKQHTDLKNALIKPCRPAIPSDCSLDDAIPNSIEIMRRLGGPVTAFEQNLRHNYHRQLDAFRHGSIKC